MSDLPFVELDAATQLYLPREPARARAQYRFIYRAPDGEEVPLLARLCAFYHRDDEDRAAYVPVMRPEGAEAERVFVICNLRYLLDQCVEPPLLTPAQAAN